MKTNKKKDLEKTKSTLEVFTGLLFLCVVATPLVILTLSQVLGIVLAALLGIVLALDSVILIIVFQLIVRNTARIIDLTKKQEFSKDESKG